MSAQGQPQPTRFRDFIRELRGERGWSRERLSHEAFAHEAKGTSVALLAAIESGTRHPSAQTMRGLAAALEISPEVFPEYRLAVARAQLDEREVGLEAALANLSELEAAASAEELLPLRKGGLLEQSLAAHRSAPESQAAKPKKAVNRRRRGRARRKAA